MVHVKHLKAPKPPERPSSPPKWTVICHIFDISCSLPVKLTGPETKAPWWGCPRGLVVWWSVSYNHNILWTFVAYQLSSLSPHVSCLSLLYNHSTIIIKNTTSTEEVVKNGKIWIQFRFKMLCNWESNFRHVVNLHSSTQSFWSGRLNCCWLLFK